MRKTTPRNRPKRVILSTRKKGAVFSSFSTIIYSISSPAIEKCRKKIIIINIFGENYEIVYRYTIFGRHPAEIERRRRNEEVGHRRNHNQEVSQFLAAPLGFPFTTQNAVKYVFGEIWNFWAP